MKQVKYIMTAKISLVSPAIIGNGEKNNTDNDILTDKNNMPFIPASSFIGVLRNVISDLDPVMAETFFGYSNKKMSSQSKIVSSDLLMFKKSKISIRDGIKINNQKGIVEEKGKFDYEIIEKGAEFSLKMIFNADTANKEKFEICIATIINLFNNNRISIGTKTSNGFGLLELINVNVYRFNFSNLFDYFYWLSKDNHDSLLFNYKECNKLFNNESDVIRIELFAEISNSLIIKSYSENPEDPDAVHIKSDNNFIIPGASFKGALRARAEKILNTLEIDNQFIKHLFGWVNNKKPKDRAVKGRLSVNEMILPSINSEIQHRIKIDRFSGGTIQGALFDSKPLFAGETDHDKYSCFFIQIKNCTSEKAALGLMLLLIKDFWTEDLAIGGEKNIGRGTFKGIKATIEHNHHIIEIKNNDNNKINITGNTDSYLESCISELLKLKEDKNGI